MKNIDTSLVKAYAVPVLVLVVIIALIPLAVGPIVSNLKVKNEQFQQKREQLSQLNKKLDALDQVDEASDNSKLVEVEKVIPSRKELSSLVIGVGSLAGKNSLLVDGMNFNNPGKVATESAATAETGKSSDALDFKVTLSGSLENLKKFLADLESAKRLLGVSAIQVESEKGGSYKFDLTLAAPFKGISTSGDTVNKPLPALTDALNKTFETISNFTSYTDVSVPVGPTGVEDPFK